MIPGPKSKATTMAGILALFNLIIWAFFLYITGFSPSLLGLGALAYFFGLRHAFDADHIAAIDNVTRKLRQDNQKPVTVGLFFSLGHSTVVLLLSLAIIISTRTVVPHMRFLENIGGMVGTTVSALFLTVIGIINLSIFLNLYRSFKLYRQNGYLANITDSSSLINRSGFLNRYFRFVYAHVNRSWKMYPVGFLFGLGFDTATEIAILGISAVVAKGSVLSVWGALLFPLLFTAGMGLMDGLDGLVMMKIYDWAMIDAARKLFFNMIVTGTSVFVALVVGLIEWLQVASSEIEINNRFFNFLGNLDFEVVGIATVLLMIGSWGGAFLYYKKVLVGQIRR